MARNALLMLCVFLVGGLADSARADGTIAGHARIPKILGNPSAGYVEMYEWNIFFSYNGGISIGQTRRAGSGVGDGSYSITGMAGAGTILLTQPLFFARPSVHRPADIMNNTVNTVHLEPPVDYSCAFGSKSAEWGSDPWTSWQSTWYQTFVATSTSVTGISIKLAGTDASHVQFDLLADNGNTDVRSWPIVNAGLTRQRSTCIGCDIWTRYRSGMLPTVPGRRYAIRLKGVGGNLAMYRRIEDGQGYAQGRAYDVNGNGQNFDLYGYVFSDNDGTVVPFMRMTGGGMSTAGWAGRYFQTFTATGKSLAGADLYYAGGDTWDIDVNFKIRIGGPEGPQIGATKMAQGAYQSSPNVGFVGVSYDENEIPLTVCETYAVEISGMGFNPYKYNDPAEAYDGGRAYQELVPQDYDLAMNIVEYRPLRFPPRIELSRTNIRHEIEMGDYLPNDTFTIRNLGGDTLSYTVDVSSGWLSTTPVSGTCACEADTISIVYGNIHLMPIGTYHASVIVNDPEAENAPQLIDITLDVVQPSIPGDFDFDGDVDQTDFGHLQECFSGTGRPQNDPNCLDARLDDDDDVDADDLAIFQACMSGANVPADPFCGL